MTTADREILLSELCARFPYTVYVSLNNQIFTITEIKFDTRGDVYFTLANKDKKYIGIDVDRIRPYLRLMKSMSPKERLEYEKTLNTLEDGLGTKLTYTSYYAIEWLNEHHFDYRNLIERGLALEAPNKMYN